MGAVRSNSHKKPVMAGTWTNSWTCLGPPPLDSSVRFCTYIVIRTCQVIV
jgi:hypothetical protein